MRQFWTEEEDEILRKMAKANRTVLEMTKVLKSRTISAIEGRAKILEIGNYHMECNLKHHVITGLSEYLMAVFQDNPWLHEYLKGE